MKPFEALKTNFLLIGAGALITDVAARLYAQVIYDWIMKASIGWNLTFDEMLRFAYVTTLLDIGATLLWGLFSLGFAARLLAELAHIQRK